MKRLLTNSLKKMPKYEGLVYRQVDDLPSNVFKQYQKGITIAWDGFSSASKVPGIYDDRKILFIVQSKTARKIENLSIYEQEQETLFLPGKFKITDRYEQGDMLVFEVDEL